MFYPKQVCEFYYSCTYHPSKELITGTIADGTHHLSISAENIRIALRLPTFDHYSDLPTDIQLRNLLPLLDYNPTLGNRTHLVLRQFFPPAWKYLTGVIGKCLGHKTSSLDQLNTIELQILYCLVYNKRTDYARLFFDHFVHIISGTKCSNYVPYPRWLALVFDIFYQGYTINCGPERQVPLLSSRIIQGLPSPDDVYMTETMLNYIAHPFTLDLPEYQPQPDAIPNPNQQPDPDQEMNESPSGSSQSEDTDMGSSQSEDTVMVPVPPSPILQDLVQPEQPHPPPNTHIYFPSSSSSHHTQIPQHTHSSASTVSDAEGEQHFDQPTPPHS